MFEAVKKFFSEMNEMSKLRTEAEAEALKNSKDPSFPFYFTRVLNYLQDLDDAVPANKKVAFRNQQPYNHTLETACDGSCVIIQYKIKKRLYGKPEKILSKKIIRSFTCYQDLQSEIRTHLQEKSWKKQ